MAANSSIEIRGKIEGLAAGTRTISISLPPNPNAPAMTLDRYLSVGDNQITIPVNAIGCIIQFHPSSVFPKLLKGDFPDAGISVATISGTHLLMFPTPPPVSFIINSAGDEPSIPTQITFF